MILPAPTEPKAQSEWGVAHTRPRCEKKVKSYCEHNGFEAILPCYQSVRKYPGKQLIFSKPLFPNYVFFRAPGERHKTISGSRHVANLLRVADQDEFNRQLQAILAALDEEMEVRLAPHISEGTRVRVLAGPLRGVEGVVDKRAGISWVILRLDFISQGAAVRMEATDLEVI